MIERIVVGTDGSETASEAVRQAAELASALGAQVHLLSAYTHGMGDTAELQSDYQPGDAARRVMDEAMATVEGAGVTAVSHVGDTDPAEALMGLADEIDAGLIIVGNKGMRGARRFLGSVANAVSHNATCAVMIIPTT